MLTPYERFTLQHFLTCYPLNVPYLEILDCIENDSIYKSSSCVCGDNCEQVLIWEPFNFYVSTDLVIQMRHFHDSFLEEFIPKTACNTSCDVLC